MEKTQALVKQYSDVINQLQGFGALLNNIKPEYLLSKEDFKHHFETKLEKAVRRDSRLIVAIRVGRIHS